MVVHNYIPAVMPSRSSAFVQTDQISSPSAMLQFDEHNPANVSVSQAKVRVFSTLQTGRDKVPLASAWGLIWRDDFQYPPNGSSLLADE